MYLNYNHDKACYLCNLIHNFHLFFNLLIL